MSDVKTAHENNCYTLESQRGFLIGVETERARIRAEIIQWLDCTGAIPKGTSYYAELLGCTEFEREETAK